MPRPLTVIGCLERGAKEGEVVIRGRDVQGTTGTATGGERGAVPSTETMVGGDADRNARPGRPIEERASMLTPRLESGNEPDLSRRIGQRALVRGEFEPAGPGRPYDTIKVASIQTIAPSCSEP